MNGKGIYHWPNGNKYEGRWKDGKENGRGKLTGSNGYIIEGNWKDGKFTGF